MSYVDYKRIEQLGEGGNGWVFLMCDNSNSEEFAVKVSKINEATGEHSKLKLERFKTEAMKVHELYKAGQKGIIPVLKYELPCKDSGQYFFVMPRAIPLKEKVQSCKEIYELVEIFEKLAETLVELHEKNITHRDIKPENILYYDGTYCFGDFGLIDFPEKEDLTRAKEALGNRKTMAPEMRTPNLVDDSKPADVYSFAKTLWIVLTNEEYAFDGQFNYFENQKLQNRFPHQHFVELYKLLSDATAENPIKRPTIQVFLNRLLEWREITKNRGAASRSLWRFIEETVVQQNNPSTVIWRNKEQVVGIVKQLSKLNFNHTFIHGSGGMDLYDITEADWVNERDILAIDFGFNHTELFKLKRLIWEIPNDDPEFSYFRLEFDRLDPVYPERIAELEKWMKLQDFIDNSLLIKEDLIINEGQYEPYYESDDIASYVTRWTDGVFLIVHKSSIYNRIQATYDGRHSKLNTEEFREYMVILQYIYNHLMLNPYFWKLAHDDPSEGNVFQKLKNLVKLNNKQLEEILGKK
ncbi:serine/threonine protein kinase [Neobacillus sp. B4I6]|uniref:protein kinase domain-containing protein n=1 Tax=Neobacillus sp. B4I6 TaxID=3373925 RepID=UPI003D23045B